MSADYARLSLWHATTDDDWTPRPALPSDLDVDVAMVGGGFTGLWTAHYLAEADPKLRIAVLEAEVAGFGASGRNGGWCSALFPASLDPRAAQAAQAAQAAAPSARRTRRTARPCTPLGHATDLVRLPWVGHRPPSWEPEPLRWLGINAGLRATVLADAEERLTLRSSVVARLMAPLLGD